MILSFWWRQNPSVNVKYILRQSSLPAFLQNIPIFDLENRTSDLYCTL